MISLFWGRAPLKKQFLYWIELNFEAYIWSFFQGGKRWLLLACCLPAPCSSLLLLAACCSYHWNIFRFTWSGEGRREGCGAVGELRHTEGLHWQLFKAHHAACELGWCLGCHTISGDLFKGVLIRVSVAKLIYIILILIYVLLRYVKIGGTGPKSIWKHIFSEQKSVLWGVGRGGWVEGYPVPV